MGTTSPEDVAAAAPDARRWFQLSVWKDRGAGEDLMARARAAGYEALMLTVDVPVAGARLRDVRNGFSIPPALSLRTLADIAGHRYRARCSAVRSPVRPVNTRNAAMSGWLRVTAECGRIPLASALKVAVPKPMGVVGSTDTEGNPCAIAP